MLKGASGESTYCKFIVMFQTANKGLPKTNARDCDVHQESEKD